MLRRNLNIQLSLLASSYGVPDLPVFWPTPESAIPNQVKETEGAYRRTLPPFVTDRRSKRFAFCRSGGKIYNTNVSDYEIYFIPKYYKFNYLTLKKTFEYDVVSSKIGGSAVWCTLRWDVPFVDGRSRYRCMKEFLSQKDATVLPLLAWCRFSG